MAIDSRRYVDIASAVIGASVAGAASMDFRVFTPSSVLETEVLQFTNAADVADKFGDDTDEHKIASAYFSYTSPAPVSRPKAIQFALHDTGNSETMLEAFNRCEDLNESYGSFKFLTQTSIEEVTAVAEANAALNVKHQFYVDVLEADKTTWQAALGGTASTGLIYSAPTDTVSLAHLPAAIMSATDYSRTNATSNYMYRQTGITFAPQVTQTTKANELDALRLNYYGRTTAAATPLDFFQRGFLCGGVTAPLDMGVHANEQWFKSYIAAQWFSLLMATRGVPANLEGRGQMMSVIAGAIGEAQNNGTIIGGKTLTPVQQIAVADASGDADAWRDVQDKGYWYNVEIIERMGEAGVIEYAGQYTVVYSKGDFVRKVSGSHNLV